MLSQQLELSLLPDRMRRTEETSSDSSCQKRQAPPRLTTETRGLLSLILAMMYKAAITNADNLFLLHMVDQVKRLCVWLSVAVPALFMVMRVRRQASSLSLQKIRHAVRSMIRGDVSSASRLSSAVKSLSWNKIHGSSSVKQQDDGTQQSCRLSASEPFVSRELLSELTLEHVASAIRYATECNQPDFDEHDVCFQSPRLQQLLNEMKSAAQEARGDSVQPASSGVDALLFCAAMRIFAEWRMLRQVPPGYKGYEMGMNLGRRDLIQNLNKLENAAHAWMEAQRTPSQQRHSPNLRQLLEYEVETMVHTRLPVLKDHTAAIGLLWVKRQVHYQACVYDNLLLNKDANDAVRAAYKQVFDSYHGWLVQQLFQQSFRAAPPAVEIYKYMNPELLEKVSIAEDEDSFTTDSSHPPSLLDSSFSSSFDSGDDDDEDSNSSWSADLFEQDEDNTATTQCDLFGGHLIREWDKAGKHIQGEFGKFLRSVVELLEGPKKEHRLTAQAMKQHNSRSDLQCRGQDYIDQEMTKEAHEQLRVFLNTIQPLLGELDELFDELNMNDPTKV